MKLLFDHNLSPRLVNQLSDLFPESTHLYTLGMDQANDREVWAYAQSHSFTIVTRNSDYNQLLVLVAFHPKLFGFAQATALPLKLKQCCDRTCLISKH